MASYNRVVLVGNLTRDPELRYIPSGTAVTEIGLAVNDRRKGPNGDWIEETTFVDVTLWGRTAEIASEYLSKGSSVLIEGRLKLDTWEKDGKKNSKLRVVGETHANARRQEWWRRRWTGKAAVAERSKWRYWRRQRQCAGNDGGRRLRRLQPAAGWRAFLPTEQRAAGRHSVLGLLSTLSEYDRARSQIDRAV